MQWGASLNWSNKTHSMTTSRESDGLIIVCSILYSSKNNATKIFSGLIESLWESFGVNWKQLSDVTHDVHKWRNVVVIGSWYHIDSCVWFIVLMTRFVCLSFNGSWITANENLYRINYTVQSHTNQFSTNLVQKLQKRLSQTENRNPEVV